MADYPDRLRGVYHGGVRRADAVLCDDLRPGGWRGGAGADPDARQRIGDGTREHREDAHTK